MKKGQYFRVKGKIVAVGSSSKIVVLLGIELKPFLLRLIPGNK